MLHWTLCGSQQTLLQEMVIPHQFTCLLRNLYAHQEATVTIRRGTSESESEVSRVQLFATPRTVAQQAPPSTEFSRQEYWGGLPFPSSGDLPDLGIEPMVYCIADRCFTVCATRESQLRKEYVKAVYGHPAYLASMQSTSCKAPDWKKHKLESRLPGEISITSDMQMA